MGEPAGASVRGTRLVRRIDQIVAKRSLGGWCAAVYNRLWWASELGGRHGRGQRKENRRLRYRRADCGSGSIVADDPAARTQELGSSMRRGTVPRTIPGVPSRCCQAGTSVGMELHDAEQVQLYQQQPTCNDELRNSAISAAKHSLVFSKLCANLVVTFSNPMQRKSCETHPAQ
jgi:hypothetical protein